MSPRFKAWMIGWKKSLPLDWRSLETKGIWGKKTVSCVLNNWSIKLSVRKSLRRWELWILNLGERLSWRYHLRHHLLRVWMRTHGRARVGGKCRERRRTGQKYLPDEGCRKEASKAITIKEKWDSLEGQRRAFFQKPRAENVSSRWEGRKQGLNFFLNFKRGKKEDGKGEKVRGRG